MGILNKALRRLRSRTVTFSRIRKTNKGTTNTHAFFEFSFDYFFNFEPYVDVSSGNTAEEDSAFSDSVEDEAENIENIAGTYWALKA